ncbi:hypothetical protein ES703_19622 [subsurface metagenome]
MACDNGVMIWDPLERFLWGIAITIAIMCGIYFIHIGRKREVFKERIIMLGLASLPIGFALSLLFTFFQVLQVPGDFSNNIFTFCGNYPSSELAFDLYKLFGVLSYISFGLGGMFFVLAFDIIVKRTRFLLTIIATVPIVLVIFFFSIDDMETAKSVFNVYLILELVFFVPFILFLYTKWSHFEFKAVSSFLFFGFILFLISLNFAKSLHRKLNSYPLVLGPISLIAGCCIMIIPIIIDPNVVSHPLTYWVLFAILTITFLIGITIIDIVLLSPPREPVVSKMDITNR